MDKEIALNESLQKIVKTLRAELSYEKQKTSELEVKIVDC